VRKAMGPVLTTGVALVAAAVVVANPVAPPVRDLQISTTQLSTSPEALIPFDKNLLKSISQPASGFNAALAQILGALAAEADRIGTEVNSNVSGPFTPASAAASQTPPAFVPSPVDVAPGATPNGTPAASTTVVAAAAAASPTMQLVFSAVNADTKYLGNKVVEAVDAAVNAIFNTPDLIFRAVRAVLLGDLATAYATIVEAVKAFFDPGLILVGGIDNVVGQYGPPPTNPTAAASAAAASSSRVAAPPAIAAEQSVTDPDTSATQSGNGKPRPTKVTVSAKRATTDAQPQLTPRSAASTPSAGNSSHSAGPASTDSADQSKQKGSGTDKSASPSSGRSQNSGGRS
jgi:hypothetical protein